MFLGNLDPDWFKLSELIIIKQYFTSYDYYSIDRGEEDKASPY